MVIERFRRSNVCRLPPYGTEVINTLGEEYYLEESIQYIYCIRYRQRDLLRLIMYLSPSLSCILPMLVSNIDLMNRSKPRAETVSNGQSRTYSLRQSERRKILRRLLSWTENVTKF